MMRALFWVNVAVTLSSVVAVFQHTQQQNLLSLSDMFEDALRQKNDCSGIKAFDETVDCLRKLVTVPAVTAKQHFTAMAEVLQNYYTWVGYAEDPMGIKQSNPLGFKPYSEKHDIVGELQALAKKYGEQSSDISLFDLLMEQNHVQNSMRDAHLGLNSNFNDYGTGATVKVYNLKYQTPLNFDFSSSGDDQFANVFLVNDGTKEKIKSIDGQHPMEWFVDTFARSPVFPLAWYKGLGSRVNEHILRAQGDWWYPVSLIGRLDTLKSRYTLNLESGEKVDFGFVLDAFDAVAPSCGYFFHLWINALEMLGGSINPKSVATKAAQALDCSLVRPTASTFLEEKSKMGSGDFTVKMEDGWNRAESDGSFVSSKCYDDYCVLSGDTVPNPGSIKQVWDSMAKEASAKNIKRLVWDVNLNEGGYIVTVYYIFATLFPQANFENAGNPVQQPIGNSTWILYNDRFKYTSLSTAISRFFKNFKPKDARNRLNKLMANECELGKKHLGNIGQIVNSVKFFVRNWINNVGEMESKEQYRQLRKAFKTIQNIEAASSDKIVQACVDGKLTVDDLHAFVTPLIAALYDPINADPADPTEEPFKIPVTIRSRKNTFHMSQKYYQDVVKQSFDLAKEDPLVKSPFEQVLVMSKGSCGSSCDAMTMSPYVWKKSKRPGPSFEYVVWGGTGESPENQNLTGTSFPGGGQGNGDRLTPVWVWRALVSLIDNIVGMPPNVQKRLLRFEKSIPEFPIYNQYAMPIFSKYGRTQRLLGKNALPSEFYIIPGDHYISKWYGNLPWGTENEKVKKAYDDVAQFFK